MSPRDFRLGRREGFARTWQREMKNARARACLAALSLRLLGEWVGLWAFNGGALPHLRPRSESKYGGTTCRPRRTGTLSTGHTRKQLSLVATLALIFSSLYGSCGVLRVWGRNQSLGAKRIQGRAPLRPFTDHTGRGRTRPRSTRSAPHLGLLGAKMPSRRPTQIHSRALPLVDCGSRGVRRGPCADAVRAAGEGGVARMCTWSVCAARRQPATDLAMCLPAPNLTLFALSFSQKLSPGPGAQTTLPLC